VTSVRKTEIATSVIAGLLLLASALAPFAIAFNLARLAKIIGPRPAAAAPKPPEGARGGDPFFRVVGPWGKVCNDHELPH
jgi:hypothetical protein